MGMPGDEMDQMGSADSHPGHEQVVDALKAAFVQGRLGKHEFDQRMGQALAAYAQLDELTADIPVTRPASPPAGTAPPGETAPPTQAAPPTTSAQQLTREAYNRGLVARGTLGGAGVVMLLATIVVTAITGNPFSAFLLGGALGVVMAVFLGTILTLILWALESSERRSSRRTRPPGTRSRATEHLASAEQPDLPGPPTQPGLPGQPRRGGRHTAEATRGRHLTSGCSQAWA